MANLIGDKTYQQWEDSFKNAYTTGGVDAEVAVRQAYADAANRMSNPYAPATTYEQIQNPANSIVGGINFGQTTQPGQSTAQPAQGFTVGGGNAVETGQNKPMQLPGGVPGAGGSGGQSTGGFTVGGGSASGGIVNDAKNGITPWNVDANQTVAGQISALTDPNNPLNQQARTQALQAMSTRGIVNSSLAQSAAQDAVLKNALPIATADAATYSKAAGYNADQQNQNFALDKNLKQQWNIAELQAETQRLNNESAQTIARMNNDQQTTANQIQQDNSRLINTNNQAATAYNNTLNYITSINQNPNMDANSKTRAVAQAWYGLQTQLRTLGKVAGLDLTTSLSLRGAPGFDENGEYVGFNDDGTTRGSKPSAAPPPSAPAIAAYGNTGAGA